MKPVAIQVALQHRCKAIFTLSPLQLDTRSIHMRKMNTESCDNTSTCIPPLICLHLYRSLCRCFCLLRSTVGSHTLFLTWLSLFLPWDCQTRLTEDTFALFPREVLHFNCPTYTAMNKPTGPKSNLYFIPACKIYTQHSVLKSTPSSVASEGPLISP